MKRIILSLILVSLIAVFAVNSSQAYLSDTETSNSNSTTAGSLNLNLVSGYLSVTDPITSSGLTPGGTVSRFVAFQNSGTIAISRVGATSVFLSGFSYLYNKLGLRIYDAPSYVRGALLLDTNLKDLSNYTIWTTLAPLGATPGIRDVEVYLPSDVDGSYQNLTTTWQFNFLGQQ